MNPKAYCTEHGIKTKDFVTLAREVAPQYDKVVHSIVSNPLRGAVLSPTVARHIRGRPERRTLPCKFTSRVSESDRQAFNAAKEAFGHRTDQEALYYAVQLYIEAAQKEVAAGDGSTDDDSERRITMGYYTKKIREDIFNMKYEQIDMNITLRTIKETLYIISERLNTLIALATAEGCPQSRQAPPKQPHQK